MNIQSLIASVFVVTLAQAAAPTHHVIAVEHVLAPIDGFDDNDMIQVVIDAQLPNACYNQGKAEYEIDQVNRTILVKQWAELSSTGLCANPAELPEDLRAAIPFSTELNIGQLEKGAYKIVFQGRDGKRIRNLNVKEAPTSTVDSLRYATVINAFVNDYVMAHESKIEIRLTLQVNSSCSLVSDTSEILVQDGVIIVLPEIIKEQSTLCLPVSRPTYKVFTIPNPGPGRFLLHVRSLGGTAKNKLFTVIVTR